MAFKENSVYNNIKRIVERSDIGHLFNYTDFRDCGKYTAIRTAVVDLCKQNYLERVCQGIYVKPDKLKSKSYLPDDITLAIEIDRKNGAEPTPKGETLEFLNGIRKKKPKILEFYSTGSGRKRVLPSGTVVKYSFIRKQG